MLELSQVEAALVDEARQIKSEAVVDEIIKTAKFSWEIALDEDTINRWLSNFSGDALGSAEAERNLALWLLSGFVFFNLSDVRAFCSDLFERYIHTKLIEFVDEGRFQDKTIEEQINYILQSSVFLSLGNDSESGSNILYYFRQVNKLKREVFDKDLNREYENLVFVDDVAISGIQALTYIPRMQQSMKYKSTYYLTFLASKDAIDALQYISTTTICCNCLAEREKCFSLESYIFASKNMNKFLHVAAKMCEYYGTIITQGHPEADGYPLGYDQSQSMFCFFYNTPDNTLPIFWCRGAGWNPLFTRFEKILDEKEAPINNVEFV